MIGLFRKRASPRPDARAIVLGNCFNTREWYEACDPLVRTFVDMACESHWRDFQAENTSPAHFAIRPVAEQTESIRKLVEFGNNEIDSGNEVSGRAAHLMSAYLSAIATGDRELEQAVGPLLKIITRDGSGTA